MAFYRESIIVRIDCDPPALLWSGVGPLFVPADIVIPEDGIALGGGELVSIPDFQQLMNGTAERLEFTLSGVDDETLRLALEDAPSVRGARVDIGRVDFDEEWQLIGIEWEAVFEARSLSISRPASDGNQITRSISLTIVAGDSTRARAPNAFFTDADQRRRSPTDAIFSYVAGINAGTSRRFGPSDA
ncbi:hypothetical protein [Sphingobium sp. CCH11-B1]|uniref:hypothetical protein n=1 Tax=Sphingobium sp. CCH11-B1 TaxID=1768781 RepID=UPI0009EC4584|nr:hypothetical protein [Sphingobium sp. CCH11-B1]